MVAARLLLNRLFKPERVRRIAILWLVTEAIGLAAHLWIQTRTGLTDGAGHPFGDDTINFWSGGRLAWLGREAEVFDLRLFHQFEMNVVGHSIDFYHYSYPPVLLLLSVPLGMLPYQLAWLVWLAGGWACFALCLRALRPEGWLLYAAAWPAMFMNAISGQNGPWTASIIGWGLILLENWPFASGLVLSLLAFKPQLAWLIPVALIMGGHRRALGGLILGGSALMAATLAAFGTSIWMAYLDQARWLQHRILEDGTGYFHRMLSAFVLVRHLGGSVGTAWTAQVVVSTALAGVVAYVWRRPTPQPGKNAVLVLCALLASPYFSDYDLVMAALVPLWMGSLGPAPLRNGERLALVLLVAAPLVAAPLARQTGFAGAGLMLVPTLIVALNAARLARGPLSARHAVA